MGPLTAHAAAAFRDRATARGRERGTALHRLKYCLIYAKRILKRPNNIEGVDQGEMKKGGLLSYWNQEKSL